MRNVERKRRQGTSFGGWRGLGYLQRISKGNYTAQPLRTGVKSRSESASFAEVAASIRSSHRLYWLTGSTEKALRPSTLSRLACSFDFVRSCLALRALCVTESLRGRGLGIGGRVVERPGGDRDIIEGRSSRGRGEENGLKDSDCR